MELAGLEMKENCQIEELTLRMRKKILFLIKLVADYLKTIYISKFVSRYERKRGCKAP